jgi:hypothetical protein
VDDIEGRALQQGIRLRKLKPKELIHLFYSMLVDDAVNMERSRMQARREIDEWLEDNETTIRVEREVGGDPVAAAQRELEIQREKDQAELAELRKNWGRTREAREGLSAATGMSWAVPNSGYDSE